VGDAQRHSGVLLDEQDRRPLTVDRADRVEDLLDQHGRQSHRRLVQQEQPGTPHEGAADGQHLLLTARQRAGHLGDALLQAREQREHPLQVLGDAAVAPEECAHHEILADAEAIEDPAALGHVADTATDDVVGRGAGEHAILEVDRALAGDQQSGDRLERGGLAGAVVAEQRDDLAAAHLQRDPLQGADLAVVDVEAVKAQHWHSASRGAPGTPR
jgi:hypothetical protein